MKRVLLILDEADYDMLSLHKAELSLKWEDYVMRLAADSKAKGMLKSA